MRNYQIILSALVICCYCSCSSKKGIIVDRRPGFEDVRLQEETDREHRRVQESGKWGRSEKKSWNERYIGEHQNIPYQGPRGSNLPYRYKY